jgi:uncharacterized protein YbaA (DUF1428 family)
MSYIDAFVIPLPTDNVDAYKKFAKTASKLWMEHGALAYSEYLADDVQHGKTTDFYRSVKAKEGETIAVGFATYKNKKHRDEVMKKVMSDPRMSGMGMPFDGKRMIFGGFASFIDLKPKA